MFIAGVVMMFKNPELLKKRLNAKETRKEQNSIVKLCGLMFLVGFLVAGLGFRFKWYVLPKSVAFIGTIIFLVSYTIYAEVLRENTYLSRTIETTENQQVIDKGLYGVVRHPMYSATLFLFLAMPLILGSIYSFFIFLLYPVLIVKRIQDEETFLEKELDGYLEYKQTRIILTCPKRQNFGAFRFVVAYKRQLYKFLRTKNPSKFYSFRVEEFKRRGFLA